MDPEKQDTTTEEDPVEATEAVEPPVEDVEEATYSPSTPPKRVKTDKTKDELKKAKRKAVNKTYYERSRASMVKPEAAEPKAQPKPRKARAKAQPLEPVAPPPSPRDQLRDLWRQVRVDQLEQRQARYRSWLN